MRGRNARRRDEPQAAASGRNRPWLGERGEQLERRLERPMLVAAALVSPALILESANVDET
jgi:hypothetical protein